MKQRMGLAERSSAIWSTGRGIGLTANGQDGREAPPSKLDGTGRKDGREAPPSKLGGTGEEVAK